MIKLPAGLEPATPSLRVKCSTDWAMEACIFKTHAIYHTGEKEFCQLFYDLIFQNNWTKESSMGAFLYIANKRLSFVNDQINKCQSNTYRKNEGLWLDNNLDNYDVPILYLVWFTPYIGPVNPLYENLCFIIIHYIVEGRKLK